MSASWPPWFSRLLIAFHQNTTSHTEGDDHWSGAGMDISRFLIVLGLVILVAGIAWPFLVKLGLGRLPGDIVIERDGVTFYFPLVTCLLLSFLFSAVYWLFNR
jgi:hypothetical protein